MQLLHYYKQRMVDELWKHLKLDNYEVEANSEEEAEEILKQKLYTGEENAPDTLIDSGAEATEITD